MARQGRHDRRSVGKLPPAPRARPNNAMNQGNLVRPARPVFDLRDPYLLSFSFADTILEQYNTTI